MRRLIFILSIAVAGFFGYTLWDDPTTGPYIRGLLPDGGMPSIASVTTSSQSENLGGMTAANRVTDAVVGAVSN